MGVLSPGVPKGLPMVQDMHSASGSQRMPFFDCALHISGRPAKLFSRSSCGAKGLPMPAPRPVPDFASNLVSACLARLELRHWSNMN